MSKICPFMLESITKNDENNVLYICYKDCLKDKCALWQEKQLTASDTYLSNQVTVTSKVGKCGLV